MVIVLHARSPPPQVTVHGTPVGQVKSSLWHASLPLQTFCPTTGGAVGGVAVGCLVSQPTDWPGSPGWLGVVAGVSQPSDELAAGTTAGRVGFLVASRVGDADGWAVCGAADGAAVGDCVGVWTQHLCAVHDVDLYAVAPAMTVSQRTLSADGPNKLPVSEYALVHVNAAGEIAHVAMQHRRTLQSRSTLAMPSEPAGGGLHRISRTLR